VRLPKEFRFEGTEVRVSKVDDKVILEPLKKQPIDFHKFWAELDAMGARDLLPDGIPDDPPVEPDPLANFVIGIVNGRSSWLRLRLEDRCARARRLYCP
jgi:antitoxin VapB